MEQIKSMLGALGGSPFTKLMSRRSSSVNEKDMESINKKISLPTQMAKHLKMDSHQSLHSKASSKSHLFESPSDYSASKAGLKRGKEEHSHRSNKEENDDGKVMISRR